MSRKVVDCKDVLGEQGCSLRISGEEDEVVGVAALHAASFHAQEDSPQVRDLIRSALREDSGAA